MTVESDLFALLSPLAGARVYPDVAPAGVARPCITYQQVGGESLAYIEAGVPNAKNGRFQVNCWGTTRLAVAALALQVENAMLTASAFQARPLGGPTAVYEEDPPMFGTRQDFSIWSTR